jgi:hypothetical protein
VAKDPACIIYKLINGQPGLKIQRQQYNPGSSPGFVISSLPSEIIGLR